jgi:hypothetical protein
MVIKYCSEKAVLVTHNAKKLLQTNNVFDHSIHVRFLINMDRGFCGRGWR